MWGAGMGFGWVQGQNQSVVVCETACATCMEFNVGLELHMPIPIQLTTRDSDKL